MPKKNAKTPDDVATNTMSEAPREVKRPAPEIRETLWEHFSSAVIGPLSMFCRLGFRPTKEDKAAGKSKESLAFEAHSELLKMAHQSGVDTGYDMGAHVFGGATARLSDNAVRASILSDLRTSASVRERVKVQLSELIGTDFDARYGDVANRVADAIINAVCAS